MYKWISCSLPVALLVTSPLAVAAPAYQCSGANGTTFQEVPCRVEPDEAKPNKTDAELLAEIQAQFAAETEAEKKRQEARDKAERERVDERGLNAEGRRRMAERFELVSACAKQQRDCTIEEFVPAFRFMRKWQVDQVLGKGREHRVFRRYEVRLKTGEDIQRYGLEVFYPDHFDPYGDADEGDRGINELEVYSLSEWYRGPF